MNSLTESRRPGFLYVVSWEVCNRLGGVHTVLESSAPQLRARYGEDLLYVGPDLWADRAAQMDFVEDAHQPALAALAAERDVPVRFGRWKIDGSPTVALVDSGRLLESKNRLLGDLWNDYAVDSIHADWDTVERILFAYATGMLIELHYHTAVRSRGLRAVAHFHQWQTAAGILRLAKTTPDIGTVYNPHGAALGRALAGGGMKLHLDLATVEPVKAAKEKHLEAPHTLEVAAAKAASVLVDVSDHSAKETAHLLGRRPDLVTPNGWASRPLPDAKHRTEVRAALFRTAERFLGSAVDPARTRLVFSSGRYEFHNKGHDLVLQVLGKLCAAPQPPERPLLLLAAIAAPQTGPRPEVMAPPEGERAGGGGVRHLHPQPRPPGRRSHPEGVRGARPREPPRGRGAHPLRADPPRRAGPGAPLQLSGCAAGERRDRLPLALRTVGLHAGGEPRRRGADRDDRPDRLRAIRPCDWPEAERRGVTVLPSEKAMNGDLVDALVKALHRFLARSDDELASVRRAGAPILGHLSWEALIGKTIESHELALARAAERRATAIIPGLTRTSTRTMLVIPGESANRPRLHRFSVSTALPERFARLGELAHNTWWCWNARARALFEQLDPTEWVASEGNPVRMLRTLHPERMAERARDRAFLAAYDAVLEEFDRYRARPAAEMPATAYFCAEFAIHESLPVYSGGLGVLAGDHLKSASDLRLPLCAVGLRYAHGYFIQRIQPDGRQGAEFRLYDPRDMPMSEVKRADGSPLRITIPMPERELKAGVWKVEVGSVPLYLLDTLVPENDPADVGVTDRLYPSDREPRLRQEILLGMGGWRLLQALGKVPAVCHLNEGHSAFLLLERLLDLVEEQGLTFGEAQAVVRASTIFTTHTPVPAGHDRFGEGLMRRYFGPVAQRLGLDWNEFLDLGRTSREDHDFSMTVLALRLSDRANGVSQLHGQVSREMLAGVWPGIHPSETPVDSITNGVHLPTWIGPEMDEVLRSGIAQDWAENHPTREGWASAEALSDEAIWGAHEKQKMRMVEGLREEVERMGLRRGENAAALRSRIEGITSDALWIGYARRFAPYKRATLLFRDAERLQKLLDDETRPVRIVFAGKSHPDDREGAELVQKVVGLTQDPRYEGRVFFVENYGMGIARSLVQGVDIWLNTPTRPLEASGTSGMKACLNGGIHLSVLDGWWCEGYDGANGWAIGGGREYENAEMQKEHDSRSLYGLLESEIVPLYYDRGKQGPPPRVDRAHEADDRDGAGALQHPSHGPGLRPLRLCAARPAGGADDRRRVPPRPGAGGAPLPCARRVGRGAHRGSLGHRPLARQHRHRRGARSEGARPARSPHSRGCRRRTLRGPRRREGPAPLARRHPPPAGRGPQGWRRPLRRRLPP
ncbi:MAG: alpha-glucan family phosphorylase, partial [Planctomycetes bacterium]|nr:alpha-glucan family phosphorylase [Planctomycetota bacterium]